MPSSIFGNKPAPGAVANPMQLLQMLKSKDPQELMHIMMDSNPQFAQFYAQNKGKPVEQVAQEHGIDLNEILKRFR